ncbi:uncharacterized protein [Drosophila tropicalis]|uniref:uncharacterized protein n=1 Tax=Drosophila tropicalis TaxID=46794 RepID=UPI0035AB9101
MPKATSAATIKFLREELFNTFGVPEIVHTDNGKQFTSKEFEEMVSHFGITYTRTAAYSPQANASERVNQSILAAIRTHVGKDHTHWDVKIPEIQAALRSAVHSTIGTSPYYAMFGQHMFRNGGDYRLARKLDADAAVEIKQLPREDQLQIVQEKIVARSHQAFEKSEKRYNLKAREIQYRPGQEVWKRNFVLSDVRRNINAKFCKRYSRCRIMRRVGKNMYELENLHGIRLGVFHAKDLKQ